VQLPCLQYIDACKILLYTQHNGLRTQIRIGFHQHVPECDLGLGCLQIVLSSLSHVILILEVLQHGITGMRQISLGRLTEAGDQERLIESVPIVSSRLSIQQDTGSYCVIVVYRGLRSNALLR